MAPPTLRPYQLAAGTALETAFFDQHYNRLLIKKPTGTGKTVWFAALLQQFAGLRAWLDQFPPRDRRMLVIAHREELLDQAADKILRANPGLIVSVEQGDRHASRYSDVVVASIQTLAAMKFRRLHRLLDTFTFRLVIVDEAHHAAADSYRTALVHLGFLPAEDASDSGEVEAPRYDDVAKMAQALEGWDAVAPQDRLLVGVTATPNRADAIGLGCVFQTIAYSYDLKQAIDDGWLVPITPWVVETTQSLDSVRLTAGEFNQKELAEAVNNAERNNLAVKAWLDHGDDQPTIAFTVDVAHAHSLADAFCRSGVEARALSGQTPKDERRELLRDFTAGTVKLITNCMVLTEGTDLPATGCILHAKPTRSATLYEQMTGRGLRIHPGKTQCIVIDVVDVARRHSLQTAPVLYGLPPGLNTQGQSLQQLQDALEALREKVPTFDLEQALAAARLSLAQLQVKASTFDIWAIPSLGAFGAGRAMDWTKIGDERYRLQYPWADGTETLDVERNMLGQYDVVATMRPKDGHLVRQRTLVTGVKDADQAAGYAEAFVLRERREVTALTRVDAPWQKKPASDKQKLFLQKLRVPVPKNCTMGQAGKLINLAKARRGYR